MATSIVRGFPFILLSPATHPLADAGTLGCEIAKANSPGEDCGDGALTAVHDAASYKIGRQLSRN
ncbi:MAG: hypothetical protein ACLPPF_18590 [Rhodomicrobium sp.]